jgi:hypothetical protein
MVMEGGGLGRLSLQLAMGHFDRGGLTADNHSSCQGTIVPELSDGRISVAVELGEALPASTRNALSVPTSR